MFLFFQGNNFRKEVDSPLPSHKWSSTIDWLRKAECMIIKIGQQNSTSLTRLYRKKHIESDRRERSNLVRIHTPSMWSRRQEACHWLGEPPQGTKGWVPYYSVPLQSPSLGRWTLIWYENEQAFSEGLWKTETPHLKSTLMNLFVPSPSTGAADWNFPGGHASAPCSHQTPALALLTVPLTVALHSTKAVVTS